MAILGAHQSIAGGFEKAVGRALAVGCQCLQLFTRNSNQWRANDITPDEAGRFRHAFAGSGLAQGIAHDSYLINLASPDQTLWRRSVDAFAMELCRAETLGLSYVVTHPGAYTDGDEDSGLRRVAAGLDEVHQQVGRCRVQCLLETTAGQGTSLGWKFEHLTAILDRVRQPERIGVCLDTCHLFAAGYPLSPARDYKATMRALEVTVGLDRVKAIHVNDSRRELGSHVDRHEHIGQGRIGLEAFRLLLNDPRFQDVPMYLETPKGQREGEDLDAINLAVLRDLVGRRRVPRDGPG